MSSMDVPTDFGASDSPDQSRRVCAIERNSCRVMWVIWGQFLGWTSICQFDMRLIPRCTAHSVLSRFLQPPSRKHPISQTHKTYLSVQCQHAPVDTHDLNMSSQANCLNSSAQQQHWQQGFTAQVATRKFIEWWMRLGTSQCRWFLAGRLGLSSGGAWNDALNAIAVFHSVLFWCWSSLNLYMFYMFIWIFVSSISILHDARKS